MSENFYEKLEINENMLQKLNQQDRQFKPLK